MQLMIESSDYYTEGVSRSFKGQFGTLKFGTSTRWTQVYFNSASEIDEVIAELVALRAEMTGEAAEPACPSCGHPIPLGAYQRGFRTCRDCRADQTPEGLSFYDRAARTPAATLDAALADSRATADAPDPLPANDVPAGTSTAVRF